MACFAAHVKKPLNQRGSDGREEEIENAWSVAP